MFGSNQFDGLFQKFDHLFALNDRIEAMVNPLGKMQAGLDAAMKTCIWPMVTLGRENGSRTLV